MAKKSEDQVIETVESNLVPAKTKVINLVKMDDGSQKNFGERNKLLSDHVITETSFNITFHLSNGRQVVYNFAGDTNLLLEMAAFGAGSKIKQACAGSKSAEEMEKTIIEKIAEFDQGSFVSRVTGQLTTSLSQIQVAYARVNGIDPTTTEGVAEVNAIFVAMDADAKKALYKVGKIKLELAKLKLEAAMAEMEE